MSGTNLVSHDEKLKRVQEFVRTERARRGITQLSFTPRPEGSCQMAGESFNLLEMQLLYTHEGYGDWKTLRFLEILNGVYEYVTNGTRG